MDPMKRRGFLGFMGGAAVAAPAVAKTAIAELPKGLGSVSMGVGVPSMGYGGGPVDSVGGNWRLKEIANLKRILTGDLTEDEKEQRKRERMYARQQSISHGVAVLVSVSGAHKLNMYANRIERHKDRIRRSETKGYLARLLRQESEGN